jgi:translocation and assembly module TamB
LGREFVLTQGTITFSGPYPPNPIINVSAQVQSADITAIVKITGPARSPQVTLTSTPPLPSDEILSRVLFGRNVSQISPIEALQLAEAARMLAGGPKGLGVLSEIGRVIGLDHLSLLPGANRSAATALGIGRQLGKNVRVDVRQGLGGQEGTRLNVEYELRPNLTLRGTLGQREEQNVELNWKKDY